MSQTGTPRRRCRSLRSLFPLVVVLCSLAIGASGSAQEIEITLADEIDTGLRDVLLQAVVEDAGDGPIELRLLRMTLQPGGKSPWHAHAGLEFGVVESGTIRVKVRGLAVVRPADATADTESQTVPENLNLSLSAGDRIAYAPGTEMTFQNAGTEPAVLLAATVFPAGPEAPPASVFRAGPPTAEDIDGIESVILGQAIVAELAPGAVVVFEQLEVEAGSRVPAFPGPVLMALDEGSVAGSVRAADAGAPGDSTSASSDDVEFSLRRGDAAFFSSGMSDAPLAGDGRIVVLRLGLVNAPTTTALETAAAPEEPETEDQASTSMQSTAAATSTPVATATAAAERPMRTITSRSTPTPVSEIATASTPADEPAAPASPSDDESTAGLYPAVGTVLAVNDSEVRIRAEPSLNGAILAGLSAGQLVVVLGEPVDADGYIWYPVQDVVAPDLQGWVAAPFLDLAATP
ncbi:MAG: cupin domain-containing protein [Chloroflexia bacterium]|nr:cupin domain-containing protein [Chloroflexia bacterium]